MSVREEKYLRMNTIRSALEIRDRSFKELVAQVYGANPPKSATRTLHFDLTGLRILGLITLEGRQYQSTENKTTYENEAEYKLTMAHSRRLMKGFDQMNPEVLVNYLVPEIELTEEDRLAQAIKHDRNPGEDRRKYFLSHLKTGYYEKIYPQMLRYREIEIKYTRIKQVLKRTRIGDMSISFSGWDEDEIVEIDPGDAIFMGTHGIPDNLSYGTEPIEGTDIERRITKEGKTPVFSEVIDNPDIVKEYITLKFDISSSVYGLLGMMINGTPLDGYCEACPLRHIKLRG